MADANDADTLADTRKRRRKARKRWNSESEDAGAPSSKIKKSKAKGSQGSLVFQIGGDITDPLNLKTTDIPGVDDIDTKSKKSDRVVESVPPLQTDPLHLESEPKPILQRETSAGHRRRRKRISTCAQEPPPPPAEKPATKSSKNSRFRYGNYSRYYGYRGSSREQDERLGCMEKAWFADKDCLDIGCNIGHVTLCIGRDFDPKSIVGLDIDNSLISVAKKNVKHYLTSIRCVVNGEDVEIPASLVKSFGPLERYPPEIGQDKSGFPANVQFQAGNWVPKTDDELETVSAQYDVILLLSTTKWIHLNWGDSGIQRAFKRVYRSLRPGGIFIMEPQLFDSYKKKRQVAPDVYKSIQFFPTQFMDYLLSDVGFTSCQKLPTPKVTTPGFKRPIYLYTK